MNVTQTQKVDVNVKGGCRCKCLVSLCPQEVSDVSTTTVVCSPWLHLGDPLQSAWGEDRDGTDARRDSTLVSRERKYGLFYLQERKSDPLTAVDPLTGPKTTQRVTGLSSPRVSTVGGPRGTDE